MTTVTQEQTMDSESPSRPTGIPLGPLIRSLRENRGWSIEEYAEKIRHVLVPFSNLFGPFAEWAVCEPAWLQGLEEGRPDLRIPTDDGEDGSRTLLFLALPFMRNRTVGEVGMLMRNLADAAGSTRGACSGPPSTVDEQLPEIDPNNPPRKPILTFAGRRVRVAYRWVHGEACPTNFSEDRPCDLDPCGWVQVIEVRSFHDDVLGNPRWFDAEDRDLAAIARELAYTFLPPGPVASWEPDAVHYNT